MTSRTFKTLAILAVTSLIAACGGGGGGSAVPEPPAPDVSAAGIWDGTNSNDAEFGVLVLDGGEYYAVYTASGNSAVVAGLIRGNGTTSGSKFTSSDGRDYNFEGAGVTTGRLDATVVFQTTLNGTVAADADPSEQVTFTSTFNPLFNQTPSLDAVAGVYQGVLSTAAGPEFLRLEIKRSGEMFGGDFGSFGCWYLGTIEPHPTGNSYRVSLRIGPPPPIGSCTTLPNQVLSGAAVFQEETEGLNRTLVIALVTLDGTEGAVFRSE